MQQDRLAGFLDHLVERPELLAVDRLAVDVGAELHGVRAVLQRALGLLGRRLRRVHRHHRGIADEAVGMLGAHLGQPVVGELRHLRRLVRAPQPVDHRQAERQHLRVVGKLIDHLQPQIEIVQRRNAPHPLADVLLPGRRFDQRIEIALRAEMTEGVDVAHEELRRLSSADNQGWALVIYKDLRGFIKQVDELGALRRVHGADPKFELGGITEVAAGTPECPALLFDRIKGYAPGFRVFTNATTTPQRAALALGIDPSLEAARRAEGLDAASGRRLTPHKPVEVAKAPFMENSMRGRNVDLTQAAGAALAPQGRRAVHRLGLDRHHARSGRRLDQRLDLPRAGARQEPRDDPVRPSRPPRRDHRQEILGQGQALPGRRGQRRGPGAVHRRLRISARRPVGIRLRRLDQGRADGGVAGPAHRPAAAGARRDHPRRRAAAAEQAHACRKARSASSPATTPPTPGPAR